MSKMQAHRRGLLHRAVSVFVFNSKNELLLQKRAADKYHSPHKWSNTCCTHPRFGETPAIAAKRRLQEEMGLRCQLVEVFTFLYDADVGNGLIEKEFDHVFLGISNKKPRPNPTEISDCKWISSKELEKELFRNPQVYSPWLRKCYSRVIKYKLQKKVQVKLPGKVKPIVMPKLATCKTCFIICPLASPHDKQADLFRDEIIRPVIIQEGFDANIHRADITHSYPDIDKVINEHLVNADLVVSDLTGSNANVFYELGKRHALGGMSIQFTRDSLDKLSFSIRQRRTIYYDIDDAHTKEKAREEFRKELAAQLCNSPKAMPLSPYQVIKRFDTTVLVDVLTKDRQQYSLASKLIQGNCRRIFLLQRSSTLILGPHRDWPDEANFYELLFQQLSRGVEFYHIVDPEGISRHYVPSDYPDCKSALARLLHLGSFVGIKGLTNNWYFRRVPKTIPNKILKPDRQARTFLVELDDGSAEGIIVMDLGGMHASFHLAGKGMLDFLEECIKYYEGWCPKLTWKAINKYGEMMSDQ
jgi:isopentenyl-diphosphate delta-isomerase